MTALAALVTLAVVALAWVLCTYAIKLKRVLWPAPTLSTRMAPARKPLKGHRR